MVCDLDLESIQCFVCAANVLLVSITVKVGDYLFITVIICEALCCALSLHEPGRDNVVTPECVLGVHTDSLGDCLSD